MVPNVMMLALQTEINCIFVPLSSNVPKSTPWTGLFIPPTVHSCSRRLKKSLKGRGSTERSNMVNVFGFVEVDISVNFLALETEFPRSVTHLQKHCLPILSLGLTHLILGTFQKPFADELCILVQKGPQLGHEVMVNLKTQRASNMSLLRNVINLSALFSITALFHLHLYKDPP